MPGLRFLRRTTVLVFTLAVALVTIGCSSLFGARKAEPEETIYLEYDEAPVLIRMLKPVYPDSARKAGIEGKVVLQVVIDQEGRVVDAEVLVSDPPGLFDESAMNSIRRWVYTPATRDGRPIKVRVGQVMEFALRSANQKPPPAPPTVADPPAGQKPPPPPPPPPPPARQQVEDPISIKWDTPPRPILTAIAAYPELARKAGIEGRVILMLLVDENGSVVEAEVVKAEPPGIFDDAALMAIRNWRFEPAMKDGKPIKVRMEQPMEFALQKPPPPPPPPVVEPPAGQMPPPAQKPPLPPPPPPGS
jgi:TonB family protein